MKTHRCLKCSEVLDPKDAVDGVIECKCGVIFYEKEDNVVKAEFGKPREKQQEVKDESLEEIMERNRKNKERMVKDRKKANKGIVRSHRLKT